jgi:hypothetical protein
MKTKHGYLRVFAVLLAAMSVAVICSTNAAATIRVPFIDVIAPIGATPGGATFTLHVRGTGFYAGAQVYWLDGTTTTILPTTVVSPTLLTAIVSANLIVKDGTVTVTVVNPSAVVPASNPMYFPIHAPFTGTISSSEVTVGGASALFNRPIGVADFNSDGILDLAVGNAGGGSVSILYGNGDGTFTAGPTLTVGNTPTGIAIGDFNHDGKADMAVEDFADATVYVFVGDGAGGFTLSQLIPDLGCCPLSIVTADFNGDGNLDLALSFKQETSGNVRVLHGNGDGTFVYPGMNLPFPQPGAQPTGIAVGDFNGDGKLDMAVSDVILGEIHILLGTGTGFTFGPIIPTAGNPAPVALLDCNGDGILDMAVTALYDSTVSVYKGDGTGGFGLVNTFAVDDGPYALAAGNFDGNQKMDLVVGNHFGNTARIWRGNGSCGFVAGSVAPAGNGPTFVAIGDFNNDGALDFVTGSEYDDTISIGLNIP